MTESNLAEAHLGQIWKSPDGYEWIVSGVYDLKSSLLIDFNRPGSSDTVIEKSVFSNATGWEPLDGSRGFTAPVSS